MKLIYTNLGILTEERVRELKEMGYDLQECGCAGVMDNDHAIRMGAGYHEMDEEEPVKVVIIGSGEDGMLGEGGMASTAGTPSYSSNQGVVEVGPQGIPGSAASAAPGGANVPDPMARPGLSKVVITPSNEIKEAYNDFAEYLLDSMLNEEEEKKKKLTKKQKKLDINKNNKLDKFDFMALQNIRKKKEKAEEED